MKETVLVTDCELGDTKLERELLAQAHLRLIDGGCRSEDDVIAAARACSPLALLVHKLPITRETLANCPSLRVVVRYGVGVENIDATAASELGISVRNVAGYATNEVADHTLSLLLTLVRGIDGWQATSPAARWNLRSDSQPPPDLSTCTLGIIGLGSIGRAVARRAHAFGMNLVAYDPHCSPADADGLAPLTDWKSFWDVASIVTIHAPLTPATHRMIDEEVFDQARMVRYLINTSRAELVDRSSLEIALHKDILYGVGLDVWWSEPPITSDPLLSHPRVTFTPHVAWLSSTSTVRLKTAAAAAVTEALGRSAPVIPSTR